jgi:hypothetical protein
VSVSGLRNNQSSVLFYGTSGPASLPFLGGTLCIANPLRRTMIQNSGGSAVGMDCTGQLSFDFNAWIASGADHSLRPGTQVNAQFYSRDPGFAPPNNIGLSDAVEFTIGL